MAGHTKAAWERGEKGAVDWGWCRLLPRSKPRLSGFGFQKWEEGRGRVYEEARAEI